LFLPFRLKLQPSKPPPQASKFSPDIAKCRCCAQRLCFDEEPNIRTGSPASYRPVDTYFCTDPFLTWSEKCSTYTELDTAKIEHMDMEHVYDVIVQIKFTWFTVGDSTELSSRAPGFFTWSKDIQFLYFRQATRESKVGKWLWLLMVLPYPSSSSPHCCNGCCAWEMSRPLQASNFLWMYAGEALCLSSQN